MRSELLLTSEHGGNRVPAAYRSLFAGPRARAALRSHRGWDPGARALALAFARRTGAPLHDARTTRLLVELNRSLHHPRVFSEFSRVLPPAERAVLVARHYRPYREGVERAIRRAVRNDRTVLHVSVHSFVGTFNGAPRMADIGLLYDPSRSAERAFCRAWQRRMCERAPDLRVRRNYPYRGVSDGLVTYLRTRFGPQRYVGIELEVSQSLIARPGPARRRTTAVVIAALLETLESTSSVSVDAGS